MLATRRRGGFGAEPVSGKVAETQQHYCGAGYLSRRMACSDQSELAELAAVVPRDFFAKAGYYQPLDDYDYPPVFNSSKIYPISSTVLSDGRVNYLRLQGTSTTISYALPVDRIAASLRCVKD